MKPRHQSEAPENLSFRAYAAVHFSVVDIGAHGKESLNPQYLTLQGKFVVKTVV